MFSARYNLLAILQVTLNAANLALLYRGFGAGHATASFLLAQSIVTAIQLVLLMFQEQFIYDYLRYSSASPRRARIYFATFLGLSQGFGLIAGWGTYALAGRLVHLSAQGLEVDMRVHVQELLELLAVSTAMIGPLHVLQQVLSASGRIAQGYLLTLLAPIALFVGLGLQNMLAMGIRELTLAVVAGNLAAYGLGLALSRPRWPTLKRRFRQAAVATVAASLKVRSAHNIHNLYVVIGLNHFSSTLPPNLTSLLFLAQKAADTLSSVVFGPTQRVLTNQITSLVRERRFAQVAALSRRVDRFMPAWFAVSAVLIVAAIPSANLLRPTSEAEILFLRVFVFLFMVQAVLIAMEVPMALVSLSQNRSGIFYGANTAFVLCAVAIYLMLERAMPLYSFGVSLVVAQMLNFYLIRQRGRAMLREP